MATKTIDPEAIWNSLIVDPIFQKGGLEEFQPKFRPFVDVLPEVLGVELLASKVSVKTLMKAKMLFIQYCVDNGFAKLVAESLGSSEEMFEDIFQSLLQQLKPLVEKTDELLKEYGVTEEQIFADPRYGIRPEVLEQINQGMTIGDLLITQPSVIVVNPS